MTDEAMEKQHAGAWILSHELESEALVAGTAIGIGMVYVTMSHGVHVAVFCNPPQRTRWLNRNRSIFEPTATALLSSPRAIFFGDL